MDDCYPYFPFSLFTHNLLSIPFIPYPPSLPTDSFLYLPFTPKILQNSIEKKNKFLSKFSPKKSPPKELKKKKNLNYFKHRSYVWLYVTKAFKKSSRWDGILRGQHHHHESNRITIVNLSSPLACNALFGGNKKNAFKIFLFIMQKRKKNWKLNTPDVLGLC